ncbi:hypothetical protein ACWDWO_24520 [Actinopolymorpha singaporensis]
MNEHFAHALAARPDVPAQQLWLHRGSLEYPRHDLLVDYDTRTRRMLDLIREAGRDGPDELTGDDLVHPDYTPLNVLFDQAGQISGIVDWNGGVARGDRHFALVGLRADLTPSALDAGHQPAGTSRSHRPPRRRARPCARSGTAAALRGALHPPPPALDAIRSRQVYAVTGNPIVVGFAGERGGMPGRGDDQGEEVAYRGRRVPGGCCGRVAGLVFPAYRLSRAVADTGRGATVEIEDESMTSDWYTFRVRQANSHWAWSSPIWAEG